MMEDLFLLVQEDSQVDDKIKFCNVVNDNDNTYISYRCRAREYLVGRLGNLKLINWILRMQVKRSSHQGTLIEQAPTVVCTENFIYC